MLANHLDQQQVHESIDLRNQPWLGLRERLLLEKIRREKSWSNGRPGPCTQKETEGTLGFPHLSSIRVDKSGRNLSCSLISHISGHMSLKRRRG
jgi:hypothetical protein